MHHCRSAWPDEIHRAQHRCRIAFPPWFENSTCRHTSLTLPPPSLTSPRIATATWAYLDTHLPHFRKRAGILNFFGVCFRVSGQEDWLEFHCNENADHKM